MKRLLFLTMLFLAAIVGCRKDSEFTETTITDPPFPVVYVKSSIGGTVVDEFNRPVADATVHLAGKEFRTDQNGVFLFKNVIVNSKAAYVRVEHPNFFHGSRTLIVSGGTRNTVKIQLLSNQSTQFVNATSGGTADFTDFSVALPAGGIVKAASGADFSGQVGVAMKWLNPTDENFGFQMPGRLQGITTDGSISGMVSMGMLAIELKDGAGQKLQIKPGFEANLRMKVPAALLSKAPATIPLWYFDEEKGYWREDGEAKLDGGFYVGKVKHFSFWNHDYKDPLVEVLFKVVDAAGNPIENALVSTKLLSTGQFGKGFTDNTGQILGLVPKDQLLQAQIFAPFNGCNDPVLEKQIGPYSQNGMETFIINLPNLLTYTITGTLKDCAGNGVLNGYVKIDTSNQVAFVANDGTGNFEIELIRCTPITSVTILGYDMDNIKVSLPQIVDVSSGTANAGNIEVCDALASYFFYNFEGKSYFNPEPFCFAIDSIAGGGLDLVKIWVNDSLFLNLALSNVTGTGTYPASNFYAEGNWKGDFVNQACGQPQPNCISVQITEFNGMDNYIAGTFAGTVTKFNTQPAVQIDVSGSFRGILK